MKKELEKCIDTLSFGLVLARLHKGSRIVIEQTRVNDEVWLPQRVAAKVDARVALLKEFNIEHDVTYRDYKKFRADKKVVPMGEVAEPRSGLAAGFSAGLDALDSTLAGRQSLRPEAAHARVVLSASAGPARAARTRIVRGRCDRHVPVAIGHEGNERYYVLSTCWALFVRFESARANSPCLNHSLDCAPKMRQAGDATLFIERRRKVSKAKRERGKEEGSELRVYRRHPIGLKQQAVERMNLGENVSALARELGVDRINLYRWRAELIKVPSGEPGVTYDPQQQRIQELEAKIAGLEGTLGRKEMELDFFAGAWRRIKGTRQQRSISDRIPNSSASRNWRPKSQGWKGPWGAKRWNWIFSPVPGAGSRGHASREASLARQHLLGNPPRGASARRNKHRADVRTGGGEPGRFLSAMGTARAV